MASTSKSTAPTVAEFALATAHSDQLGDYAVDFVTIKQTHSLADMLKGLPDDACQCPHWGYVLDGSVTFSFVGGPDETYRSGDAFYVPPGHVPTARAGTELVQFSPQDKMAEVQAVMMLNAARLASGG